MAQPLTWRNVNAPNFNLSGLNAAANAFSQAGNTFDRTREHFNNERSRTDDLMTNEAIGQALATGEIGSLDSRVDVTAVQDALGTQIINKNNSIVGDLNAHKLEHADVNQDLDEQLAQAQIDAEKASQENNQYDLAQARKEQARLERGREGIRAVNAHEETLFADKTLELLTAAGFGPDNEPTEDDRLRIEERASAWVKGAGGHSALRKFASTLGVSNEFLSHTKWGTRNSMADQLSAEAAARRFEEAETAAGLQRQFETSVAQGNFKGAIFDPTTGIAIGGTPQQLKDQALSNNDDLKNRISSGGFNVSAIDLSDDEIKRVMNRVRTAFPSSSIAVPLVASYLESDGTLDTKGLESALNDTTRDLVESQVQRAMGGPTAIGGGPRSEQTGNNPAQTVPRTQEESDALVKKLVKDVTSAKSQFSEISEAEKGRNPALVNQLKQSLDLLSGKQPIQNLPGSVGPGSRTGATTFLPSLNADERVEELQRFEDLLDELNKAEARNAGREERNAAAARERKLLEAING